MDIHLCDNGVIKPTIPLKDTLDLADHYRVKKRCFGRMALEGQWDLLPGGKKGIEIDSHREGMVGPDRDRDMWVVDSIVEEGMVEVYQVQAGEGDPLCPGWEDISLMVRLRLMGMDHRPVSTVCQDPDHPDMAKDKEDRRTPVMVHQAGTVSQDMVDRAVRAGMGMEVGTAVEGDTAEAEDIGDLLLHPEKMHRILW